MTSFPDLGNSGASGAYAALDDRELWRLMARRDSLALDALFDRYLRAVCNHCFRLTASWHSTEEMASSVFLRAWQTSRGEALRGESALPWLLTVATNLAHNERRAAGRRLQLLGRVHRPEPVPDPADEVASRLDAEARMREVLLLLHQLPRAECEAIVLCLGSGVSYADAAAALGIAEARVQARVSRGRARLTRLTGAPDPPGRRPRRPVPTGQEDR